MQGLLCKSVKRINKIMLFKILFTKIYLLKINIYQDFVPFNVYVLLDGLYLALVSIDDGSLPWLGSVNPKQPINSPLAENKVKIMKSMKLSFLHDHTYTHIYIYIHIFVL